ncbi:MAG: hypothetical protein M3454_14120 [Actinomycetota bacterium]|nr:hypothetical protein [Actinomycetota bacterium]
MVVAAERSYRDAVRWIKTERAPLRRAALTRRATRTALLTGLSLMGTIGLLSPESFGVVRGQTSLRDWPPLVVVGLVAACVGYGLLHRAEVRSVLERLRDPYVRPLHEHPGFEGAADALAMCPRAYRARFALVFVYRPLAMSLAAVVCALSTTYFVIDAILARFLVGWSQPVYALVFLFLALILFYLAAPKLSTWRVAASVHKEVTTGY